jgi:Rod binding domain-containing protein
MTAGMKTPEVGGGGTGEDMFKSLLAEEMAKQVSKAGGIGVAAAVQKEMLKMQGLKE